MRDHYMIVPEDLPKLTKEHAELLKLVRRAPREQLAQIIAALVARVPMRLDRLTLLMHCLRYDMLAEQEMNAQGEIAAHFEKHTGKRPAFRDCGECVRLSRLTQKLAANTGKAFTESERAWARFDHALDGTRRGARARVSERKHRSERARGPNPEEVEAGVALAIGEIRKAANVRDAFFSAVHGRELVLERAARVAKSIDHEIAQAVPTQRDMDEWSAQDEAREQAEKGGRK